MCTIAASAMRQPTIWHGDPTSEEAECCVIWSCIALSSRMLIAADFVESARVVPQPVSVATDAPILRLQLIDHYPHAARIVGRGLRALRRQHHSGEITDQPLLCQQVETVHRDADFDKVEWLFVIGSAGGV